MTDPLPSQLVVPRVRRRRLLQLGAAGAVTLWAGSLVEGAPAEAAPLQDELRRTSWLEVSGPAFTADTDAGPVPWQLAGVSDLPIAAEIPTLRDNDAAFTVQFTGAAGVPQGIRTLHHAELGTISLFVVPVGSDGGTRTYEAVIDRTVRIAGVNEEGAPVTVVVPDARVGTTPATGTATTQAGTERPSGTPVKKSAATARPRLARVALARGQRRTIAVATVDLASAKHVTGVRAQLRRHGKVVARTTIAVRRPTTVSLRFAASRTLPAGGYELVLTLSAPGQRVTQVRRSVRLR